ncbi:hypothetical protein ACFL0H_08010 [Thermodesulfobacteriota bacterium]
MAWKEQCEIAFKANAEAILHKQGGRGVRQVLRQLSKESDIPYKTLERWYYKRDEGVLKNEDGKSSTQNNKESEKKPSRVVRGKKGKFQEGTRAGPGRRPKFTPQPKITSDVPVSFKDAYDKLSAEIGKAKRNRWRGISRADVMTHIQWLIDLVEI